MQYDATLYITLQKSLYVQWGPPHFGEVLEPSAIAATGKQETKQSGKQGA